MAFFRKRGKKWEYRISYQDKEGKNRIKAKGGFSTKKEAQEASLDEEKKLNNNIFEDKTLTFSDFFKKWTEIYKKPVVGYATWKKISMFSDHVEVFFETKLIKDITPTEYQKILNEYGKKYAQETISQFNHYIKASLKVATRERLIDFNFAELATAKSSKESRPIEESYLEADEYIKLIATTKSKYQIKSYMAIYLIAVTGMRFAECLGLTWKDIDFKNGFLDINKTWNYQGLNDFQPTKTADSNRKIPIDKNTSNLLKQFKTCYPDDDRLFTHISHRAILTALKRTAKRNIHIHSLRHTYASFLISKGVDIISVSKLLGHSDINITLSTYAHELEELRNKNENEIKKLFDDLT